MYQGFQRAFESSFFGCQTMMQRIIGSWGSRGREFKSRHSDQQKALNPNGFKAFFIFTAGMETAEKCTKSAQNVHIAEKTP